MMIKYLEIQDKASKTKHLLPVTGAHKSSDEFVQFTTIEMHFVMSGTFLKVVDSAISL